MPYRDERLALEAQRDDLLRELAAVGSRLAKLPPRPSPLDDVRRSPLDDVRIASPCHVDWEGMTGDDRVRFCHACEKNVYNLAAMTRDEAERLFYEHEGRVCVRLFRRTDGTVLTSDCEVGARARRSRRKALAAGVGAGAAAAAGAAALLVQAAGGPVRTAAHARVEAEAAPAHESYDMSHVPMMGVGVVGAEPSREEAAPALGPTRPPATKRLLLDPPKGR
jgi:hypothetical protein